MGEDEGSQKSFKALKMSLCGIFLDTIWFYGPPYKRVLRDQETGEITGLAPNFDNNITLRSSGYEKNVDSINDRLAQLFYV